ncbi:NUDIX hydrolase [Candidatus Saccharibacteria bacterium]|nr:NUDIX hydrolase [Candidatus Saccharibacteria bacterium]
MTITSQVYEIIFEALEHNPDGLQWSELARIVKQKDPNLHPKTVNGLIWKLVEKNPDKVYKPEKGRFRLVKYRDGVGVIKNNGHVDYLYRVAVRALIRNEKGQILVVKEKSHNWWRLPGGGLDYGESVKEGLKRELKEEVGLSGDFDYRIVVLEDASWNERLGAMQINAIFEVKAHTANFSLGTDGVDMAFESLDNIYLKNPAYSLIIATLKAAL